MTHAEGGADGQGYRERTLAAQDGRRLYYRDYGDANAGRTPLLCLGGLTRNSKDFHNFAARLAPSRRVLCLDYRGRGRSEYDTDWRRYDPTVYLDDIRHLLAATNCHRVVVVGTSLGGLLAMGLAVTAPTAVAAVVLNDVGPALEDAGLDRILSYVGADRPQADWESAIAELRGLFPDMRFQGDAEWLAMARNTYRRGEDGLLHFDWDPAIVKPLAKGQAVMPDLWAVFGALRRIPCLALRGELSTVLSEETFARMAREKPDMTQVTVPGVGHTPSLDEPEARAALDAFLATH
ncbi:MAG: alpha/beta fold hydrolase [Alphaproteobacteria bacterium]